VKHGFVVRIAGAVALLALFATAVQARNEHCAGGIQYVSQALRDKDKGNTDDYLREMNKAVFQLNQCATDDPNDFEAMGYLAWAYAELDSDRAAGPWFQKAIDGLGSKGDKKKLDVVTTNRRSYWVKAFNAGVGKMKDAGALVEADKNMMPEAQKKYASAINDFDNALALDPGDPSPLKNKATAYTLMGQDDKAEQVYMDAARKAPSDTTLMAAVRAIRNDRAMKLIDKGDYDGAITALQALAKEEPGNSSRFGGLGDAYFEQARHAKADSAAKRGFRLAGDAYAKASDLNKNESTLAFNAGIAYYNCHEYGLAEPMFRRASSLKPDNLDALCYLGATLAANKKYDESGKVFTTALAQSPKEPTVHRMLGFAYNFAGNGPKASEEYLIRKALEDGKAEADAGATAKAATGAPAKLREGSGMPDQISDWELKSDTGQTQKIATWFYWAKKKAYHFSGADLVAQSDWNALSLVPAAGK
jgi:tetratricopeptide (TPR) repeat protein